MQRFRLDAENALAPGARYPTQLKQANTALEYLSKNAQRLHIDPHFILAGDSAGAHIAAQLANAISSPPYATTVGVTPSIARPNLIGVTEGAMLRNQFDEMLEMFRFGVAVACFPIPNCAP